MSFKRRAVTASMWSLLGNGGRQIITFVLFVYVARNVSPADVGLIALAMIVIEVVGFASRFGQVETLQRESDPSETAISTSFWMLAVAGVLVTTAILAAAGVLGTWWQSETFAHVLTLLAPICALQAWNAVPEALLKRRLDYRSLAARTWLATLAGGLTGAIMATHGFGVYALVGQRVVTALVQTVTIWAMLRWRPRLAFDRADARRLFRIGFGVMLASFSSIVNKRVVDGIVGSVLGVAQLGHFHLGWRFFDFIVQFAVTPITSVALTMFSNVQHHRERLTRLYLRLTQFVALASLPMFFGLGAIADLLVPTVLGDKWNDSVIVMQLLGFVMLGGTVNYFFAPMMIAVGRVDVVVRQSTLQIVGTALFVFVGAHFGIGGVLGAIIARTLMVAAYNAVALRRFVGLPMLALAQVLMPPVLASAAMVGTVDIVKLELAGPLQGYVLLAVLILTGVVAYALALFAGDLTGLWRGYVRSAVDSLAGAISRRSGAARMRPA